MISIASRLRDHTVVGIIVAAATRVVTWGLSATLRVAAL
jgi:hypothetical protein